MYHHKSQLHYKDQGHIQAFFDIPTFRQKLDFASNVGFAVALQFLRSLPEQPII